MTLLNITLILLFVCVCLAVCVRRANRRVASQQRRIKGLLKTLHESARERSLAQREVRELKKQLESRVPTDEELDGWMREVR